MLKGWWRRRAGTGKAGARVRLELERLENRTLPAFVSVGPTFPGMDFNASGFEPPDTDVAVAPAHVVETVNTVLSVFNKSNGALLFQQGLPSFFAPVGATGNMIDPVVTYDDIHGRFVVGVIENTDTPATSFFDFAVSNSADPTQGFAEMHRVNVLRRNGSGTLLHADYPKVGWNADALVFTMNLYTPTTGTDTFDHVLVVTSSWATLLDGNAATFTDFLVDRPNNPDFTLAAASMHGAVSGQPMWFVEEDNTNAGLFVYEMTNVLTASPTFIPFDVSVPAYGQTIQPAQPGGKAFSAGALDTRILNAAMRGNVLVAAQTVGTVNGADDQARWYQFTIINGVPSLTQSGEINPGPGVDTYVPAVDVSPSLSLGLSYLESSSGEFLSMYVTGREAADLPGTMEAGVLVKGGQANYTGTNVGDFSGIGIDPVDGAFWAGNEFANLESTNWGTWIAHFNPGNNPPLSVPPTTIAATALPGGLPVLFTITLNHGLYRHDDIYGWTQIGAAGTVRSVSAVTDATGTAVCFVQTVDNALYRFDYRSGWQTIGGPGTILASSAGLDAAGHPEAFIISTAQAFYEFRVGAGWAQLGAPGSVLAMSGANGGRAYVVTSDRSVFLHDDAAGWTRLTAAGFGKSLAAVVEATGNVVLFAVTADNAFFRYQVASGWLQAGASGTVQSATGGIDISGRAVAFALTANNALVELTNAMSWVLLGNPGSVLAAAAADLDRVYLVTADHSVFQHDFLYGFARQTGSGFALG